MFEIRTLAFFLTLTSFVLVIEMLVLRRIFPNQGYLKFLFLTYLFLTVGTIGLTLRGIIPDFLSVVIANFFIAINYYCDICAGENLIGRKNYRFKLYGCIILIFAAASYYLHFIAGDFGTRVIISTLLYGIMSSIFAWTMFVHGRKLYSACAWIGGLMTIGSISMFSRSYSAFVGPGKNSFLQFSQDAQFLLLFSTFLAIAFGFLIVILALQIDAKETRSKTT